MLIGWGCFLVIGVMAARYSKGKTDNWFKVFLRLPSSNLFQVHQAFQSVGMLFISIGFIIALVMVEGSHFMTDFHGQLGVTIMSLAYVQFLGGVLRPHAEEGCRNSSLSPKTNEKRPR